MGILIMTTDDVFKEFIKAAVHIALNGLIELQSKSETNIN